VALALYAYKRRLAESLGATENHGSQRLCQASQLGKRLCCFCCQLAAVADATVLVAARKSAQEELCVEPASKTKIWSWVM